MKKITSLLALFLVALGINAQVTTTITSLDEVNPKKAYTMTTPRAALCVSKNGQSIATVKNVTATVIAASREAIDVNENDENQQFAFVEIDGAYYLYSVGAKKFLKKNDNNKFNTLQASRGDKVYMVDKTDFVMLNIGKDLNFNIGSDFNFLIDSWNTPDDGNKFVLKEVADFDPTEAQNAFAKDIIVPIKHMSGDRILGEGSVKMISGSDLNDLSSVPLLNFIGLEKSSVSASTEKVGANTVITVNYVVNEASIPAFVSPTKENVKWGCLNVHANLDAYFCRYSVSEGVVVDVPEKKYDSSILNDDAYLWCVVGNPIDGFAIYNKSKGLENSLIATDPATLGVAENGNNLWNLVPSMSTVIENAVCFQMPGSNKKLNHQGSALKYWNAADEGSSFKFFELGDFILPEAEALSAVPVGSVGSNMYFVDDANNAAYANALAALKENKQSTTLFEAMKNQIDAVKACKDTVAFDASCVYRIQNVMRGGNLEANGEGMLIQQNANTANVNALWNVTINAEGVVLKHLNSNKVASNFNAVGDASAKFLFKTIAPGEYGFHKMVGDKDTYMVQFGSGGIGTYDTPSKGGDHGWYLIPVESIKVNMNKVNAESWASLYLPFGVKLANGVEAYAGKINGNVMNLTKVDEVPANYGVILKGTDAKYTLTIAEVASSTVSNDLKGTNVDLAKVENSVVLGNNNGVGFYAPKAEKLLANKAYAVVDAAAAVNGLKFVFGEATGVEGVEVETENANAVYYDLSGRRVANPTKGIYVVNGKKVYVK